MQAADLDSMVDRRSNQTEDGGSIPTSRLSKKDFEVRKCDLSVAQLLVRLFHYSRGGSNTAVLTAGMWKIGEVMNAECMAVTWWIPPTMTAAASLHPQNPRGVLSLSRVVAVPWAPKNTCSFVIRHSMRFIDRTRWPVLVTYADEWQGHDGSIYRSLRDAGWIEEGCTKPERTYVNQAGRMVSRKRGPTTLTHGQMIESGCKCVGAFSRKRYVNRGVRA